MNILNCDCWRFNFTIINCFSQSKNRLVYLVVLHNKKASPSWRSCRQRRLIRGLIFGVPTKIKKILILTYCRAVEFSNSTVFYSRFAVSPPRLACGNPLIRYAVWTARHLLRRGEGFCYGKNALIHTQPPPSRRFGGAPPFSGENGNPFGLRPFPLTGEFPETSVGGGFKCKKSRF